MMRRTLVMVGCAALISAPAAAQGPASAPVPTNGEPVIYVGLFARAANGRVRGSASSAGDATQPDLTGIVYLAPCDSTGASSNLRPPAAATDVWKLGGRVVSLEAERATVDVTWQRVREGGKDVAAETKAGAFQLRPGERQTLESLTIPARGACAERAATLDITYTRRPVARRVPGGGSTSVRVGRSGGGSGIGRGTSPTAATATAGSGRGRASISTRRLPVADLWLVHKAPSHDEQSQHLRAEVLPFPRASTFAPVTISTSAGTFTVDVECDVEDGMTPEGEPRLFVSASRTVNFAPSRGQARDRRPLVEGSIKTAVARPGPGDVLEFALPAIQYPGAPAVPDQLSIRLKLTMPKADQP